MFRQATFIFVAFTLQSPGFLDGRVKAESPAWGSPSSIAKTNRLPSRIQFDAPSILNCREVTTEEFANTHSLEKLLEVPASCLLPRRKWFGSTNPGAFLFGVFTRKIISNCRLYTDHIGFDRTCGAH